MRSVLFWAFFFLSFCICVGTIIRKVYGIIWVNDEDFHTRVGRETHGHMLRTNCKDSGVSTTLYKRRELLESWAQFTMFYVPGWWTVPGFLFSSRFFQVDLLVSKSTDLAHSIIYYISNTGAKNNAPCAFSFTVVEVFWNSFEKLLCNFSISFPAFWF